MATKGALTVRQDALILNFALAKSADEVEGATIAESPAREGQKEKLSAKRIAIADDEEDLISAYKTMVTRWGYQVEFTASNGADIIQALLEKKIKPNIVLLDYRMRMMNGLEAAKKIRLFNPSISIVILSADDSIREQAIGMGLIFLEKPFSLAQLKEILSGL